MHGRSLILPLALGLALALTAPVAAEQVTVKPSDDGERVKVHVGDKVRIVLPANPTTGYSWSVDARPAAKVARLTRSTFRAPDRSLPGAGGTQLYVVRARGRGATRFAAVYRQVGSDDVGRRFRITIAVRERGHDHRH